MSFEFSTVPGSDLEPGYDDAGDKALSCIWVTNETTKGSR
jgi:hypothetical protein